MFGNTRMQLLFSNPNAIPKKLNDNGFQFKYPNIDQALENLCK
jgi:NAD dependent epimerase/dehydratase family enzyme